MIDYELFEAAAPPLCGGQWLIRAAQSVGLGPGWQHRLEQPWEPESVNGAVRLSLVRNPINWLEALRLEDEPTAQLGLRFHKLLTVRFDSLEAITRAYLQHSFGAITDLFFRYQSHVVERYEDMPWAFDEFLETFGVPERMRTAVVKIEREEVRPDCPRWVRDELRRSDPKVFEMYDY